MNLRRFFNRLWRNRVGFIGFVVALLVVAAAVLGPWLAPYDPLVQSIRERFQGPSAAHLLGTDNFGRDTLSRILHGYRTSVLVSLGAVAIATVVGGGLGLLAAYWGGWLDRIIMRFMDVLLAFPIILLAIAVLAVLGPGSFNTGLAIGIVYTPVFARLARGPALTVLSWDYVAAARALGGNAWRILGKHVTPNIMAPILVQVTLSLSTAILVEASLSFLGLGTQPPTPSLGLMLSESRGTMLLSPWVSVFSGLAILLASFGFNLFGDGLRDLLDPTLRDA
ncbi:MAG: ABC transporter permease [Trueperaceae bacterium]|nr:ABC transporter permease [Truepera sp.]HRN17664.1 ABC transporter permease [Trueperaceae bacterium]HRQ10967.1 ABC transporter permease [Trueperaceae bacterium]